MEITLVKKIEFIAFYMWWRDTLGFLIEIGGLYFYNYFIFISYVLNISNYIFTGNY